MSIMMTAGQVRMGLKIELGVVNVFICSSLYFVFIVNLAVVKGMKLPFDYRHIAYAYRCRCHNCQTKSGFCFFVNLFHAHAIPQ